MSNAAAAVRRLHAALTDQPLTDRQEAWFRLWAAIALDVFMECPESRQEHYRALVELSDGLRN